jgi:hypothetical protein
MACKNVIERERGAATFVLGSTLFRRLNFMLKIN